MKIMTIMAHPDDSEVWAGGTLAKYRMLGHDGHIVVMTYGKGDLRGGEAEEGARRLGCTIDLLGFPDTGLRDTDEAADKLVAALEREEPQILVLHNPDDTHPDHEASTRVARRAIIRWYAGSHRPAVVPSVFAANSYKGMGLSGPLVLDTFVDIAEVWDKKVEALKAHKSQGPENWIPRLTWSHQSMGLRPGYAYAEGFRRLVLFSEPGEIPHLDPALLSKPA